MIENGLKNGTGKYLIGAIFLLIFLISSMSSAGLMNEIRQTRNEEQQIFGILLHCPENRKTTPREQTVEYEIIVSNTGSKTDTFKFEIGGPGYMLDGLVSGLTLPDGSFYQEGGDPTWELDPNENATIILGVNIWYSSGTFEINVTGRSISSEDADKKVIDVITTFTTVSDMEYGIDLECFKNQKTTPPRQEVDYDILVKNIGSHKDEFIIEGNRMLPEGIYASFILPNGDQYSYMESIPHIELEPGDSEMIVLRVNIYYTSGTFTIEVIGSSVWVNMVDPNSTNHQGMDTISTNTTVIVGEEGIDLVSEWKGYENSDRANDTRVGAPVYLTGTVWNRGGYVIRDVSAVLIVDNEIIQNVSLHSIPGNSGNDVSFNWTPAEEGYHDIALYADPGNDIQELDETNNEDMIQIQVLANDQDPPPSTPLPPAIMINNPDNGSTVSDLVMVSAEIIGCNCTLESSLYLDGSLVLNGTPDHNEIVIHAGQHYFIWNYLLNTSEYEDGYHILEVKDTHGRNASVDIGISNDETDPLPVPFDPDTTSSNGSRAYKGELIDGTTFYWIVTVLMISAVIIGIVAIIYQKKK